MKMYKHVIFIVLALIFSFASYSCDKESTATKTVDEIKVSPEILKLKVGETATLSATITPVEAGIIVWSSSNSSIAAVSNGKVHAGAIEGTAVITAQAGGKKATCVVTVTEKQEVTYPLCYEVSVNIGIRTVTTLPSGKDPAPKHESIVQISGVIVGTAVVGRVEKIVSDPNYWAGLAQHGTVPVFTGSSDYKLRDPNDYSNIIFQTRGPLQVNVKRTEMDYVTVEEGGKPVEKYTKVYDFLSEGKNPMQAIMLSIVPYFPSRTNPPPPILPQYVVGLDIQTYTEYLGKAIVGNGHSLKWDYLKEQLQPTGNALYMGITGKKTETDPGDGVESPLIGRDLLNTYFLKAEGGSLSLGLKGSEKRDDSGTKTESTIMVNLNFRSIPNMLALPALNPPPPQLEDWDWE